MANNGPFAFPVSDNAFYDGMTLRDCFAAKALLGILSGDVLHLIKGEENWHLNNAREAYRWADAMLQARKEGA